MKKALRLLLVFFAVFIYLFVLVAAINMISKGEMKLISFIYGSSFFIKLIGLCIVGFCALGEKPKKK